MERKIQTHVLRKYEVPQPRQPRGEVTSREFWSEETGGPALGLLPFRTSSSEPLCSHILGPSSALILKISKKFSRLISLVTTEPNPHLESGALPAAPPVPAAPLKHSAHPSSSRPALSSQARMNFAASAQTPAD